MTDRLKKLRDAFEAKRKFYFEEANDLRADGYRDMSKTASERADTLAAVVDVFDRFLEDEAEDKRVKREAVVTKQTVWEKCDHNWVTAPYTHGLIDRCTICGQERA